MEVTYVTTHLPFPVEEGGGARATHGVIQAVAASASVSLVVLTPTNYEGATVRAAQEYYEKTCRSLTFRRFPHLNPSRSQFVKAWHYLSGYPRQGFWSRDAERELTDIMTNTRSEVLWCNTTHEAKYLPAGKRLGCRTVMTTQNVESDLLRQEMKVGKGLSRLIDATRYCDLRRLEKMGARSADVITAITSVDLNYYTKLKDPEHVFLLPFGYPADKEVDGSAKITEEPNSVYFFGSMDWPPNAVAARQLVEKIMPEVWKAIPDAKCFLVGKNPDKNILSLRSNGVTVTGKVPSVREYYRRAAVVAVPIGGVGGVKIKLMEAMAAGKAIVSTPAGAAGIAVEHGKHLLIAGRPTDFARALIDLLGDESYRRNLGKEAQRFVIERLSPKETERQVRKIIQYLSQL